MPKAENRDQVLEATVYHDDQNEPDTLKLVPVGEVVRHQFLSRLLNHYARVAA